MYMYEGVFIRWRSILICILVYSPLALKASCLDKSLWMIDLALNYNILTNYKYMHAATPHLSNQTTLSPKNCYNMKYFKLANRWVNAGLRQGSHGNTIILFLFFGKNSKNN
jgi:hypothetical protein